MEICTVKIKNSKQEYTIPRENLIGLAMIKAMDMKKNIPLKTEKDALDFFESIGVTIEI
jgi:hypothetical protein